MISLSQRPLPDNTHNRQICMHPVGFEPTISAGERPQTYALYRAATGISSLTCTLSKSFPLHPTIIAPIEIMQTSYKILKLMRPKIIRYKCRSTITICKSMHVRPLQGLELISSVSTIFVPAIKKRERFKLARSVKRYTQFTYRTSS